MVKFWEKQLKETIRRRAKYIKWLEAQGIGEATMRYKQKLKEAEHKYDLEWKK